MKKRLFALAMVCTMLAASMAGCGSSSSATQAPATEAPATEAPATEAPETEAPETEEAKEEAGLDLSEYTYVDIAHVHEGQMPADPALQLPKNDFFSIIGEGDAMYNLEVLSYCVHTGTHMDAPHHVLPEEGTVETIPADILIGPACVIRLDVEGDYEITVDDIKAWEAENGDIQEGEAVLFDTKHDQIWESDPEGYITAYPHLVAETAEYLVEKGVRYIGCEAISPDTSEPVCHKILLSAGVEIVENVCNLDQIPGNRCYTIATFPNAKGNTGVWTRILAYSKN